MMILRNKLPSIYHYFIPEILDIEIPEEQIATCDTCTLCHSKQSPYFNTKCCSYHPHLANFLVGGILSDESEWLGSGRDIVLKQIEIKVGVTPYGIIPPLRYSLRKKKLDSIEFWLWPRKETEAQCCPYYKDGNCTIWKYRENLCVTHFCSSIGGATGKRFWTKVNKFLKMAETNLAQYSMLQLGWPPEKIKTDPVTTSDFNFEDDKGVLNEENYTKLWGEWLGREKEFFIQCYEIVRKLDPDKFKWISGISREILEAALQETQKEFLQKVLPDFLRIHPEVVIEKVSDERIRLTLGETFAEIPSVIIALVMGFNGKRSTVEMFHLGYNVLFNMNDIVDELREKGILINACS